MQILKPKKSFDDKDKKNKKLNKNEKQQSQIRQEGS